MPTPLQQIALMQWDELPVLQIRNDAAEALIALQGAQVLSFVPRGQRPVIWLSEQAQLRRGQSPRGGIPVCWPWFGDLARNPEPVRAAVQGAAAPAHGLVRSADWILESAVETPQQTDLTLRYPTPAGLLPAWPHSAELRLAISVGRSLRLRLITRNIGTETLPFTQALHTYFAVSAIGEAAVDGLDGAPYIDTLQEWRTLTQNGTVTFNGETDRIYLRVPPQLRLRDAGWHRSIYLRAENSASAVVWNPWIEKARRLSQFPDDAWQRMLCIETANVMGDSVHLAPGAEHTLGMEIWSETD